MNKKLIAILLAACVLSSGCGGNAQEKEDEVGAVAEEGEKETDSGEETEDPDSKKQGNQEESETIDDFSYEYEESKINCHLFKSTSSKKISLMITISCDEENEFSKMSYMQSTVDLSSINPEVDFLISLSVGEKTYGVLRENGEISMVGERLEEKTSGTDKEAKKTIDFSNELKKFLKENGIN